MSPQFRGTGGKHMRNAGVDLMLGTEDMAFMGFGEVVKNLFRIRRNFKKVKTAILDFNPDVIILVDYPGFNLRIARWAKQLGYKIVYYIAPQVWAWKENRVNQIRAYVDLLLVILPFEKEFFRRHEISAVYVGHPLLERVPEPDESADKQKIALLPGSRKQEIDRMLPVMIEAVFVHKQNNLVVAGMSEHGEEYYQNIIKGRATLVMDNVYGVLNQSKVALVTSGTATLETALMRVPQVVCYATSALTYWIAKRLIKVNYISLVNLILERPAVPEIIQGQFKPVPVKHASMQVLSDSISVQESYTQLRKLLGDGDASKRAALTIVDFMSK